MVQTTADVDPTTAAGEASCAASTWRSVPRRKIRAAVLVRPACWRWSSRSSPGSTTSTTEPRSGRRPRPARAWRWPGGTRARTRRPVAQELEALADSGVADADQLRTLTSRWTESGSAADTEALTRATEAAGRAAAAELRSADRKVSLILVAVLLLVSWGWFVWFRRLVRRHRDAQRGMTERTGHRRRRAPTARVGAQQHGRRGGDRAGLDRHVPLTRGGRPGLVTRRADRTTAARDRVPAGPADAGPAA